MAVYTPRLIEPSNQNMWTELGRQATGFGAALRDMDAEKKARQRQAELDERDQNRYVTDLEMTPGVSRVAPGTASHGIQRDSLLPAPTLSDDWSSLTGESPAGGRLLQAHLPGLGDAIRAPEGMTRLSAAPGLVFDPQWRQKEEEAAFGRTQEREAAERRRMAEAFDAARSGGSVGQYIAEGGSPQDLVERPMTLEDQLAHQSRLNMLPRWESPRDEPLEDPARARMLREARLVAENMAAAISQNPGGEPNPAVALMANFPDLTPSEAWSLTNEARDSRRATELDAQGAEALIAQRTRPSGGGGFTNPVTGETIQLGAQTPAATPEGEKQVITQDQAAFLRERRGMTDEQINELYEVR